MAYYTVFSIVPLLVVIIAVVGMVFGQEAAQGYIIAQIEGLVGPQSASAIQEMLEYANRPSSGVLAAIVGIATLLLGASGVFGQLQDALNTIWDVEAKEGKGLLGVIKDRFISFLAVLGTGFLLTVSLIFSAWLAAFGKLFEAWLPLPEILLEGLNFSISFAAMTVLFAMIFKVLPDAKIVLDGCLGRRGDDITAVHDRKICARSLSWKERHRNSIRGSRLPRHCPGVGLLFRTNPSLRSRVYIRVCRIGCGSRIIAQEARRSGFSTRYWKAFRSRALLRHTPTSEAALGPHGYTGLDPRGACVRDGDDATDSSIEPMTAASGRPLEQINHDPRIPGPYKALMNATSAAFSSRFR